MGFVLDNYNKLKDTEEGRQKFAEIICEMTPYFKTIEPSVIELRKGFGQWSMKKRRAVENHIGTVHAIAMCNLCEITAGLTIEVSLPETLRWIPMGMNISYLKKAKTDLTAKCDLGDPDWFNISEIEAPVSVYDTEGQLVVQAQIKMKVGPKT